MTRKRRTADDGDPPIITSVSLPVSSFKWIKEHGNQMSEFVREAVNEKIERSVGYEDRLTSLDRELKELQSTIENKQNEYHEVKAMHESWMDEKELNELSSLIRRAIVNIKYKTWQEVANDLDSARTRISTAAFADLVKRIWDGCKTNGCTTGTLGESEEDLGD